MTALRPFVAVTTHEAGHASACRVDRAPVTFIRILSRERGRTGFGKIPPPDGHALESNPARWALLAGMTIAGPLAEMRVTEDRRNFLQEVWPNIPEEHPWHEDFESFHKSLRESGADSGSVFARTKKILAENWNAIEKLARMLERRADTAVAMFKLRDASEPLLGM